MSNKVSFKEYVVSWMRYGGDPIRFIHTFLDNSRTFLRGSRPSRGPLVAVFNPTYKCNARCSFCDYHTGRFAGLNELRTEEKVRMISELADTGVWLISFCSAEPLLADDLGIMIETAGNKGLSVNISTNGALLCDKAEMIVSLGVDTVTVSVDSHRAEVHDRFRGREGLFGELSAGIEKVVSLRKGKRPWITVRHLVNAETFFELEEFVSYWEKRVDAIVLKPIFSSASGVFSAPEHMRPSERDEKAFRCYFSEVLNRHSAVDTAYHRSIPDHLFGRRVDTNYCLAGTFFTDIAPTGELFPCSELGESFGNVVEEGFGSVWKSDALARFRQKMKDRCKCPDCWGDKFEQSMKIEAVLRFFGGGSL